MLEILEKLCNGEGSELDIYKLEKLAVNIQKASICGLGQSAPNPVISTLKYFREEFRQHAIAKECKALECKAMSKIIINEEKRKAVTSAFIHFITPVVLLCCAQTVGIIGGHHIVTG